MAEAVAAGAAAPFLIEGVKKGEEKAKAIYEHAVDVLTRQLEQYDYEKVLYQGFSGTAVFMCFKLLWHIYVQALLALFVVQNPGFLINNILKNIPFFGNFLTMGHSADVSELEKQSFADTVEKDPILKYGKPVFETYWFLILIGLWVAVALFEEKRIKSLRTKRRHLMRLVAKTA